MKRLRKETDETGEIVSGSKSFEDIRQTNQYGAEYWSARTLQIMLGYSQWRRCAK